MNLQAVAASVIGAVNPRRLLNVQISIGAGGGTTQNAYTPQPLYATPGGITASIAEGLMTVTAQTSGQLMVGQTLYDMTSELPDGVQITAQLSGAPGGIGTYSVDPPVTIDSEAMTTQFWVLGQVQPITWRDIQQLDGINQQGTRNKVYLNGRIDGLIRSPNKGGDLITDPDGTKWLVEGWNPTAGWTCAAITRQDSAS